MILPILRNDQKSIALHDAKTKVLCMGRRWGKTVLGGSIVAHELAVHGKAAWIAPTYKNTRPMWRWLTQAVSEDVKSRKVDVSKSERTVTTYRDGFLGIYSGDNIDSIRGEDFRVIVVDEASRLSDDDYFDAIMPTVADHDGDIYLISTPKGKNWFYAEYLRGQDNDHPETQSWNAPTSDNPNPNIKKAFQLVKDRVPESTYRQEWLAQFVDDGSVFRRVSDNVADTWQDGPTDGHQYVIGCDWAQSADFTVLSVFDITDNKLVYVDRFNQIEYAVQVGRLQALYERFKAYSIIPEANSIGQPIIEQIQALGLPVQPFTTTNATKAQIIQDLQLAFERDAIKIPEYKPLINELNAFESKRLPSGLMRYEAPSGMHDDCVMSLALAYHGVYDSKPLLLFS